MLDEDPTSPEVLELVALIFGRAGRFGGTDRMLTELTFHTTHRAAGLARGAVVWDAARPAARGLRAVGSAPPAGATSRPIRSG